MKPRTMLYLGAGLALLIFAAVQGYKWAARKEDQVRVAVEGLNEANEHARVARSVASVALADAERLEGVAQAYKDSSAQRRAAADGFKKEADSLKREFEIKAANAPADCAPVIESARLTFARKDAEIGSLRFSLGAANHRGDTLEAALIKLRPATSGLIDASAKVDTAATKLADTVRPAFFKRMVNAIADFGRPKFGVSVVGGVDLQGKLNAVAGVSLGWTF